MIDFASYKTIWNDNIGSENQPIFHMMFLNVLDEKIHEHKNMNIYTYMAMNKCSLYMYGWGYPPSIIIFEFYCIFERLSFLIFFTQN